MNILIDIIVALGAGGLSAYALLKFLGTSFIQHQLDKSLKTHDAHLTQKTESLKTELSIYAHEQSVALSRIDAQGAQAIHNIYSALRAWVSPATQLINGSPLRGATDEAHLAFYSSQCEAAHNAAQAFLKVLSDHAIYLDSELYETLAALGGECGLGVATVLVPLRQGPSEGWPVATILAKTEVERVSFSENYNARILPSMQNVTERFRKLLGTLRERAL